MARYVDIHVAPSPEDAEATLRAAKELGYSTVAVTGQIIPKIEGLDSATRTDLRPRRAAELLESLRKLRWRTEVISVHCSTKDVARQAAKDRRVDLLTFTANPAQRRQVRLDEQEAGLAEEGGCAVEYDVSALLDAGDALPKLLSVIRGEVRVAERHGVPVVLASGADSPLRLREPRAVMAAADFLGIDEDWAKRMLTEAPRAIIDRNRAKLREGRDVDAG